MNLPAELAKRPLMGENSQFRTIMLFINAPTKSKDFTRDSARFALGVEDVEYEGITYPSFHRLFVETDDETGYTFANKYLLGMPHLLEFQDAPWFEKHLQRAKQTITVRRHSANIKRLQEKANQGDTTALKFLIDCKHLDAPPEKPEKVGRPTKKRIQQGIDEALADDENLLEDYKRLGISVDFLEKQGKKRDRKAG